MLMSQFDQELSVITPSALVSVKAGLSRLSGTCLSFYVAVLLTAGLPPEQCSGYVS